MLYILLVLLILEWILISQPVVEIGSAWLEMTEQFTIYEIQGSSTLMVIIAIMHIVSIAAPLVPLVMKRNWKGIYYIPALITSLVSAFLYAQVAMRLDSLITDTAIGDLIQFVSVDVKLTTTSMLLAVVSVAACALSIYMVLRAGKEAKETKADIEIDEVRPVKHEWDGKLFEKGNIREAAIVLVAMCLVVSVGLSIPTVLQSIFGNSIVDSWYAEDAEKGDSPAFIFYDDNTCKVQGYSETLYWSIVDGKLVFKDMLGQKMTCDYGWEGTKLVIDDAVFTRTPGN